MRRVSQWDCTINALRRSTAKHQHTNVYHWHALVGQPKINCKNVSANRNMAERGNQRKLIRIIERMFVSIRFYNFKNSANRKKQIVVDQSEAHSDVNETKWNEMKWMGERKKETEEDADALKVHRNTHTQRRCADRNERYKPRTHTASVLVRSWVCVRASVSESARDVSQIALTLMVFRFFHVVPIDFLCISHILLECAMDKITAAT